MTLSADVWLFVLGLAIIAGLALSVYLGKVAKRKCRKKRRDE